MVYLLSPGDCCGSLVCAECNDSGGFMAAQYQVVMTGWAAKTGNCTTCDELNDTFIIDAYVSPASPGECEFIVSGCLAWGKFSFTCGDAAVQIRIDRTLGLQVAVVPCNTVNRRIWPFSDADRTALTDPLDCLAGGDIDGKSVSHNDYLKFSSFPALDCEGSGVTATVTAL